MMARSLINIRSGARTAADPAAIGRTGKVGVEKIKILFFHITFKNSLIPSPKQHIMYIKAIVKRTGKYERRNDK